MKILFLVLTLLLSACSGISEKLAALKPASAPASAPTQPAAPASKGDSWTPITESASRTFYYEPYGLALESPGVFTLRIASVQKEAKSGTVVRKPDIVTWKINCVDSSINSSELDKWIPTIKGTISEFIKNEICGSVYPVNRLTYHYVGLADRVRYYVQGNEVVIHGGADDARAMRILSSTTDDSGKQRVLLLRYEVNCRPKTNLVYNTTDDRVMVPWRSVTPGDNSIDAFLYDRACNSANVYMARVKAFTEPDPLAGSRVQFRAPLKEPAAKPVPAANPEPQPKGTPKATPDTSGRNETPITGPSDLKSPLQSGSGAVWRPSQFGPTPPVQPYGNGAPASGSSALPPSPPPPSPPSAPSGPVISTQIFQF